MYLQDPRKRNKTQTENLTGLQGVYMDQELARNRTQTEKYNAAPGVRMGQGLGEGGGGDKSR